MVRSRHFLLILSAIAMVGCADQSGPDPALATRPRTADPAVAGTDKKPRRYSVFSSDGVGYLRLPNNPQTREFLIWAHAKYAPFCGVNLDHEENCVAVNVHPCYEVSDEELKVISGLRKVESLAFDGHAITDEGLRHLETMPVLRKLRMFSVSKISDDALERLRRTRSDLEIELP